MTNEKYFQGLTGLAVFTFFLILQLFLNPYNNDSVNSVEALGLTVSLVTFFLGLYTFYNETKQNQAGQAFEYLITFSILSINIIWFAFVSYKLIKGYNVKTLFLKFVAFISCGLLNLKNKEENDNNNMITSSPNNTARTSTTHSEDEEDEDEESAVDSPPLELNNIMVYVIIFKHSIYYFFFF